jgi:hypothetical protein
MTREQRLAATSPADEDYTPITLEVVTVDAVRKAREQRDEALTMLEDVLPFVGYAGEFGDVKVKARDLLWKHGRGSLDD